MNDILGKAILSREKTISVLEKDLADLEKLRKEQTVASASVACASLILVKRQRLEKVQRELDGFKAAAAAPAKSK